MGLTLFSIGGEVLPIDAIEFAEKVKALVNEGSMRRFCKSRFWGDPPEELKKQGYGGVVTADRFKESCARYQKYGGTVLAERLIAGTPADPAVFRLQFMLWLLLGC